MTDQHDNLARKACYHNHYNGKTAIKIISANVFSIALDILR